MTWRAATLAALLVGSVSGTECTDFTYADVNARYGSQIWEEPHGGYELFEDLYVTPCTIVKFSYGSNHDVWLMANEKAFTSCCFEDCGSLLVGESDEGGGGSTDSDGFHYEIGFDASGVLYMADSFASHCEAGQRVKVIIQDTLPWDDQLGTEYSDESLAIAFDSKSGDVIIAGYTFGDLSLDGVASSFPQGGTDAFLRKLSGMSGANKWAVQEGSSQFDRFTAVATNRDGDTFVTGYTWSDSGLYQSSLGEVDAFVAKYDGETGVLRWGVQCCGGGSDFSLAVAAADDGRVAIAGESSDSDHRLPGQTSGYGGDFIGFINMYSEGGDLEWSKDFHTKEGMAQTNEADSESGMGTSLYGRDTFMEALLFDSSENLYVSGYTQGTLFSYDNEGLQDTFVAKLDGTDGNILWTYHFGSSANDRLVALAIDSEGDIYAAGYSDYGMPLADDYIQANSVIDEGPLGKTDLIVVKLDGRKGWAHWHAQIGSAEDDFAYGIDVDAEGNVIVVGATADEEGSVFGDNNKGKGGYGAKDMFALKLDGEDGSHIWSTQLGSDKDDAAYAVAASPDGDVFVTGSTAGDFAAASAGRDDVFVLRLCDDQMVTSLTLGERRAKPADGFFEGDGIWWAVAFGVGGVLILCVCGFLLGQHITERRYEKMAFDAGFESPVITSEATNAKGVELELEMPPPLNAPPPGLHAAGSLKVTPSPDGARSTQRSF